MQLRHRQSIGFSPLPGPPSPAAGDSRLNFLLLAQQATEEAKPTIIYWMNSPKLQPVRRAIRNHFAGVAEAAAPTYKLALTAAAIYVSTRVIGIGRNERWNESESRLPSCALLSRLELRNTEVERNEGEVIETLAFAKLVSLLGDARGASRWEQFICNKYPSTWCALQFFTSLFPLIHFAFSEITFPCSERT